MMAMARSRSNRLRDDDVASSSSFTTLDSGISSFPRSERT